MVRVFIFVAIIASVAAFKAPNSVVVTPAVPKVLELRGGASIGPLTPSLLTKVQCFMYARHSNSGQHACSGRRLALVSRVLQGLHVRARDVRPLPCDG